MSGQGKNKIQVKTDSFTIPRWLLVISEKCGVWNGFRDCPHSDDITIIGNRYGPTINLFTSMLKHTQDWQTDRSLNLWIPQTL